MSYIYIFGTVFFTVVGQLLIKWQMARVGKLPDPLGEKLFFLLNCFLYPWIVVGFFSAIIASLCWMAAMTKFNLSYAYPFMSLSFVLVMVLSGIFLDEQVTITQILGLTLIIAGIIVGSR